MKTHTIGRNLEVSAIGLGCMGMSQSFPPIPDRNDSIALIRGGRAWRHFFDTAQVYGPFDNEEIVGEALEPVRDQVVIANKFGFELSTGTSTGTDNRRRGRAGPPPPIGAASSLMPGTNGWSDGGVDIGGADSLHEPGAVTATAARVIGHLTPASGGSAYETRALSNGTTVWGQHLGTGTGLLRGFQGV